MSKRTGWIAVVISIVSLCCSLVCIGITAYRGTGQEDEGKLQYVMYVGTNDKDTYKPEHTNEEAREIVDRICLKYFEGYTLQDAIGSWTDEKKNITHEYTLVCYFDGADAETVHKAADEVIKALNQNTVLIEQDEINLEYYSGK